MTLLRIHRGLYKPCFLDKIQKTTSAFESAHPPWPYRLPKLFFLNIQDILGNQSHEKTGSWELGDD